MSRSQPLIINFTPTGMIPTKDQTPHVPISANEIIEDVHKAYEIGITIVHLHARDNEGVPTYRTSAYQSIIEGIRNHCPDLVTCISLSGRNFHEFEKRSEALALQPDMGSLTLGSLNFPKQASINSPDTIFGLLAEMKKYGVTPELECFDSGMINYSRYLISKNHIQPPYYYNLLFNNIATAQPNSLHIGTMINDLPSGASWAMGGIGTSQLSINSIAIALGGGVRVGLEDNIWFDQGRTKLATNIELIDRIHKLAEIFDRSIMKPEQFGKMGFYNTKYRNEN